MVCANLVLMIIMTMVVMAKVSLIRNSVMRGLEKFRKDLDAEAKGEARRYVIRRLRESSVI